MEEFSYDGEECLSGECALCNPDHPKHEEAKKAQDEMFGIQRTPEVD